MQFSIERPAFLKALSHLQSVVERKTTVPILSHVMIQAGDNQLDLQATDMDIALHETVPSQVTTPGKTTVSAHTLYDIIRKFSDQTTISLSMDESQKKLTLQAGRSRFSLSCLPVDEFPIMTASEFKHEFTIQAAVLKNLVDRTRFAISHEETRHFLNGIYFHTIQHSDQIFLRAVATDGHRLARAETACETLAENMPPIILPRKTVLELRKLLDDSASSVTVKLSESRIQFSFDNILITSKLIDGTFPDYEKVIPQQAPQSLRVNCHQFLAAVDRVATISNDAKTNAIKLAMQQGNLVISASSTDQDSAVEEIEADYEASPMEVGFNSRYLLDIAQQIQGHFIELNMKDSASPTIVTDGADPGALYVIMPMRV